MSVNKVNVNTLRRLPNYYDIVCEYLDSGNISISSTEISKIISINDSQVRKDISTTGCQGKPNVGYNLEELKSKLESFLDLKTVKKAAVIGTGNLGIAIARYDGFKNYGIVIDQLFDDDPLKIDMLINGNKVNHVSKLPELSKENDIEIAILAIPSKYSSSIINHIVCSNIKAVWNFTSITLNLPANILVLNENLAASLITLTNELKFSN